MRFANSVRLRFDESNVSFFLHFYSSCRPKRVGGRVLSHRIRFHKRNTYILIHVIRSQSVQDILAAFAFFSLLSYVHVQQQRERVSVLKSIFCPLILDSLPYFQLPLANGDNKNKDIVELVPRPY